MKWMEPFTDLLPCLFDQMHSSNLDLLVDHTISELVLCCDDNANFLLASVEMSLITTTLTNREFNSCVTANNNILCLYVQYYTNKEYQIFKAF